MSNVEDIYPLSPVQQGMLFHSLYAPTAHAYVDQTSLGLLTELDVARFREAWQRVVDRHATLRTSFEWEGLDEPLQIVHRSIAVPFEIADWRDRDAASRAAELKAEGYRERSRGFDLGEPCLMRIRMVRLGDAEWRLFWTSHHLILDGWSGPIVLNEVFAAYEALVKGGQPDLPEPPRFRDYIEWLLRQPREHATAYWTKTLGEVRAASPVPLPPLAAPHETGPASPASAELKLSEDSTEQLRAQARSAGVTVSSFVQLAWAVVVGRYARTDEAVFGVTVSGRPPDLPRVDEMVGLFINTLPVRVHLAPRSSVRDALRAVQQSQSHLIQYQDSSIVDIQGCTQVPRGTPLFESIVVFQNMPLDSAVASSMRQLTIVDVDGEEFTSYALTLIAAPGRELGLQITYDRARFATTAVQRLLGQLRTVLDDLGRDLDRPIGAVSMLGEDDARRIVEWGRGAVNPTPFVAILTRIQAVARAMPEAIAVEHGPARLTYGDLNRQADQLASYLRARGVGPDVRVGVGLHRSPELVVALLGVLKAGGAYVPLDPAYPASRLAFMIADAGIHVLITSSALRATWPAGVAIVDLDAERQAIAMAPLPIRTAPPFAQQLAYVIYTSGSTGRPKGAMIPHAGLSYYIDWCLEHYSLTDGVGAPVFSSISFDLTVTAVFAPLVVGKTVVLAEDGIVVDEAAKLLRAHRPFSLVKITPAHLQALGRQLPERDLPQCTRVFVIGGEQLTAADVEVWRRASPETRLVNEYGPTETVVGCITYDVPRTGALTGAIPIGRPISNARAYVLDASGQPAPIGVAGELHIGGPGVGRGYLNRPDVTAAVFVPDPFAGQPGARMYRTGDLARWRDDGELEFVGRVDHQVKVRGYRVELGEIESVLSGHAGVARAAVVARATTSGDRQLVAYLEARGDVDEGEVRAYLRDALPDYMVPEAIVVLEALPLTENGKVDRRALPEPELGLRRESQAAYVAPEGPIEERLAEIWQQVLGIPQVGALDDFFRLGGHSLRATQVVGHAREQLGADIELQWLFEAPTVRALAARIADARAAGAGAASAVVEGGGAAAFEGGAPPAAGDAVALPQAGDGSQPLSFAQQRLWFLDQLEPNSPFYNNAIVVRIDGALDVHALQGALEAVVARHDTLRTRFVDVGGEPRAIVEPARPVALTLVDLRPLSAIDRDGVALQQATLEVQVPFSLAEGPLVRARLWQTADHRYLAVLTLHHIVSDGWSNSVLLGELSEAYGQLASGGTVALPPLALQYGEYAAWQRKTLQGETLERHLQHWQSRLAHLPDVLSLPTDFRRPAVQSFRGGRAPVDVPAPLVEALRALALREGATLFMVLLAAWQAVLGRHAGEDDVAIGTPIANRPRPELAGLIGFFVNTLVLRGDLSGNPTLRELVGRARATALEAFAHQDVPFEMLVERLRPARALSHTPLFQSMLVLDNTPMRELHAEGVLLTPVTIDTESSRFDLTLELSEGVTGLSGALEFNSDLWLPESAERFVRHWVRMLEALAADAGRHLADVELTDARERRDVVETWNRTTLPYPSDDTLPALVELQASVQPDADALVVHGLSLTYLELDRRATQLARTLREAGVRPGVIVGVSMHRSPHQVVSFLAVLKAGGAYLPLDPGYPADRLAFMVADAGVALVLSLARDAHVLASFGGRVVLVDREWDSIAQQSDAPLSPLPGPDDVAYVIYTSGSTGQPKGALLTHRGLCNLVVAQRRTFGVGPGSRVLQFSSLSFDASIWEMVMALGNGATLCLAPSERLEAIDSLRDILRGERITTVTLPPTVLAALPADDLPDLAVLIAAGERCGADLVEKWAPGRRFFNAYGPTETTVCATVGECREDDRRAPSIGRPLPNAQVYVLDRQARIVPVGVPGELCVGGVLLAHGYWRRPSLTAERFVPHPFSATPGARLYRTGDLARWRGDGTIEYLGRLDAQVKIRGHRVEPGEIETALRGVPGVLDAAVVPRPLNGDLRLVAYVTSASADALAADALRQQLLQRLPDYLVPSAFVELASLPLTPSGKVDRRALPEPGVLRPELAAPYVAPVTATETALAHVWATLLGVERVGVHDDFFALGGHSLLATQVLSRVRAEWGVQVPLRLLFEGPTVAALGAAIDQLRAQTTQEAGAPGIRSVSRDARRVKRSQIDPHAPASSTPESPVDASR